MSHPDPTREYGENEIGTPLPDQHGEKWEESLTLLCNEHVGQLTHVIAEIKSALDKAREQGRQSALEEVGKIAMYLHQDVEDEPFETRNNSERIIERFVSALQEKVKGMQ